MLSYDYKKFSEIKHICHLCKVATNDDTLFTNHLNSDTHVALFNVLEEYKTHASHKRYIECYRRCDKNGNNHTCKVCDKTFSSFDYFFRHLRTKTHHKNEGRIPYEVGLNEHCCKLCNYRCFDRSSFNKHERTAKHRALVVG